jgi:YggT family protein
LPELLPVLLRAIYEIVDDILALYWWAIVLAAVFSNLLAFGVLDRRNSVVWMVSDFLYRVTEPALRPFRQMLPNLGGIDISPIFALIIIGVIRRYILPGIFAAIATGNVRGLFY